MSEKKIAMPDFLKDTLQAAREPLAKVEARVKETYDKVKNGGTVNQAELKKTFDEMLKWVRDASNGLEKAVNDGVTKTLGALNLPTKDDLMSLEKKVDKLAKDLNALKKVAPKAAPRKKTAKGGRRAANA